MHETAHETPCEIWPSASPLRWTGQGLPVPLSSPFSVLRLQRRVLTRDAAQVSLLFAMEQHPCNKSRCKTGNTTEVCKIMSGVKTGSRGRWFTISSDISANSHHMKPVSVSFKTQQTNVTLHQHVTCVVVLLQKWWRILHGFNKRHRSTRKTYPLIVHG